jgi:hypothetical protein
VSTSSPPRQWLRSVGALLLGFVVVVILSLATDQLARVLGLLPSLDQPAPESGALGLVLSIAGAVAQWDSA